jgi:hypothetical protein
MDLIMLLYIFYKLMLFTFKYFTQYFVLKIIFISY